MRTNYELQLALESQANEIEEMHNDLKEMAKQIEWLLEKKEIEKKYKVVK